jgi:two-component system sensor histidine kinase QseC
MTLQRRLLRLLLIGVPLTWLGAFVYAALTARHEINELFDTQQIRLAQQVASILPPPDFGPAQLKSAGEATRGEADLSDLSVAVWAADGTPLLSDREGAELPFSAGAYGFVDMTIDGEQWRTYYLPSEDRTRLIAVGLKTHERDEVLHGLLWSELLPWLLTLPLLIVVIAGSVRRALQPVRALAHDVEVRGAEDLRPVHAEGVPAELQPLVAALNRLFRRIGSALENERRLTADAAHELRTPLAALRAQWEAAQAAKDDDARRRAFEQVGTGIDRLGHLVAQLLTLAGAESATASTLTQAVAWPHVVGSALSDCLPLMDRRGAEVEVHWPEGAAGQSPAPPLPLMGDEALLATMLRNLIDNALRYAPPGTHVHVRFAPDRIVVEDEGPGIAPEQMAHLGDRFHRPAGQAETGSGLGVSIVRRIAALHGLDVRFVNRANVEPGRTGLRVELRRERAARR